MTPKGFQRALRSFASRRPFRHFWIEYASGDRVLVSHPEAALVRGTVVVHTAPNGRQRLFDSSSVCQLLDVESEKPA